MHTISKPSASLPQSILAHWLPEIFILFFLFQNVLSAHGGCDGEWSVEKITFTGNSVLGRQQLLKHMTTLPSRFWKCRRFSFLQLMDDLDSIKAVYYDRGYLDADIRLDTIYRDTSEMEVAITIAIEENSRIAVDSLWVSGNTLFPDSVLKQQFEVTTGDLLVPSELRDDAGRLREFYTGEGYLFAEVDHYFERMPGDEGGTVVFAVEPGPIVRAGTIDITGLNKVRPSVIDRSLLFEPGDTLTSEKLEQSQRRLNTTGLFDWIAVEAEDTLVAPYRVDIVYAPVYVELEETEMLKYRLSGGWEQFAGYGVTGAILYANLFGRGHAIALNIDAATEFQNLQLQYSFPLLTVPFFLVDIELFLGRRDRINYEGAFTGGRIGMSMYPAQRTRLQWWTRFENGNSIDPAGPADIQSVNRFLAVGTGIDFESRRTTVGFARSGLALQMDTELAGPLKDESSGFWKSWIDAQSFMPLFRSSWTLISRVNSGIALSAFTASDRIPTQERFVIGQNRIRTVRGYDREDLSPKNETGNVVGGNLALVVTPVEIAFPIYKWVRGAVFGDVGYVWPKVDSFSPGDMQWGVGAGIRVTLAMGTVGLDYGVPLNDEKDGMIHLSVDVPVIR
ncbi:MAG: BamA/TamA family outer membrane protein [Chitinivibrionales bacterium]|nr:BamA/TamA family outer membrane protein [Chitinivibrionales bacterium]